MLENNYMFDLMCRGLPRIHSCEQKQHLDENISLLFALHFEVSPDCGERGGRWIEIENDTFHELSRLNSCHVIGCLHPHNNAFKGLRCKTLKALELRE